MSPLPTNPFRPATVVVAGTVLWLSVNGVTAQNRNWTELRNERYGFSLQYPADVFVLERTADAGDGQVFASKESDAKLLVGALANESGYTPTTYQNYIAQHSYGQYRVDYRRLGRSWFALSGEGGGKTFYEKVMFSCEGRLINSFAMIYPTDQRSTFDPIVEHIEDTFRPSSECQLAELAPKPPPTPSRRTPSVDRGERSAMADRIARARGYDVILILRRTTPPYDRKVVRGYASRP